MLIKLLIPAAIGQFMISQQPKLIAKAVVTPVTHGVVHGVTHALGHGLSRSVTTAVTHALSRAQDLSWNQLDDPDAEARLRELDQDSMDGLSSSEGEGDRDGAAGKGGSAAPKKPGKASGAPAAQQKKTTPARAL